MKTPDNATDAILQKLHDDLLESIAQSMTKVTALGGAEPVQLFEPAMQNALGKEARANDDGMPKALAPAPEIERKLAEIAGEKIPDPRPPSGGQRLDVVGDEAVKREFLDGLKRDGKLADDPANPGWQRVSAGLNELAARYNAAISAVSKRENRVIHGGLMGTTNREGSWPGGMTLGSAATPEKAMLAEARNAVGISARPLLALAALAENPMSARTKAGGLDADGISQVLEAATAGRNQADAARAAFDRGAGPGGRRASPAEAAYQAVIMEFAAAMAPGAAADKALAAVASLEKIARESFGPQYYDAVKSTIRTEVLEIQQEDLAKHGIGMTTEAAPAAQAAKAQAAPEASAAGMAIPAGGRER